MEAGAPGDPAEPVAVIVRLRDQADLAQVAHEARRAAGRAAEAQRRGPPLRGRGAAQQRAAARADAHEARVGTVVEELRAASERGRASVQGLLDRARAAGRASTVRPYWIFNGFAATVDAATLQELAAHPDVASVTLDETLELPEPTFDDGPRLPSWSLESVGAPQVWGDYGITGQGMVVGVLDSGVDGGHPALAGSYRGRDGDHDANWFAATGENYPTPGDGHGHGTHVAGSIVGGPSGAGDAEVIGVAPGAEWIAAKIFRDTGTTTTSIIHAAAEWVLAPGGDPSNAPHVVNNSWGSTDTLNTAFWDDVAAWVAAGIVPIFANGNNGPGPGSVGSPASFPHAIGVGATDRDDIVATFSSRGPVTWDGEVYTKPQISAPGVDVRSTWPRHLGQDYRNASGTSMAAPHAAGVAALVLSANPDLSVDEVREILEATARTRDHMGAVPNNAYGHGVVDAFAATTRARFSGVVAGTVTGGDGEPLEATVRVAGTGLQTVSDPGTGAFELAVVEGTHTLEAAAFGYHAATAQVIVEAGARHEVGLSLAAAAVRTLSGTVAAGDGQPVAGARVEVRGTPVDDRHTDAGGAFAVSLPEGTYDLAVRAPGYRGTVQPVTVDGDTSVTVTLRAIEQVAEPGWRQFQNDGANTGFSGDALAAPSLAEAWTTSVGRRPLFGGATVAGDSAYLTTDDGRLHALSLADGSSRWTFTAGANLRSTPLVEGGTVYLGGGDSHTLYALDAADGTVRWQFATEGERLTYTTPTIAGGVLYFATGWGPGNGGTVYALDPETGDEHWSYHVGGQVFFGPAVGDGLVYAGSADARRLVALDALSGEPAWEATRTDDTFVGAAAYHDGELYVITTDFDSGRGALVAYDAATGTPRWERDHGDGQANAPVVYDDLVLAGSHTRGTVTAYDRSSGEVVWRYVAGGPVSVSQLATGDGYLVGGSQLDRRVWALDITTGTLAFEDARSDSVLTAPAFAEGLLVTADGSGTVTAYRSTGVLAGTVTGPGGPVPASVRVAGTDLATDSDPDTGAYELVLAPGDVTVEVVHYGLARAERDVEVLAGRTTTADFSLEAVGDGSVEGSVTTSEGEPLGGVTATLLGTPLEPVTTAGDGSFAFPQVAAGRWGLRLEAPGYVPATVDVDVAEGEATAVSAALERFDVAVLGDHEGRIAAVLEAEGLRVEHTEYADVASRAADFRVVVANGAQDRPADDSVIVAFLEATDAAGTSVVWLDQWSVSYGAIRPLSQITGDPAQVVTGSRDGRVSLTAVADHPLTAGLPPGGRAEFLTPGSDHGAYRGYTGRTVADLHTDGTGTAGGGIGYQPRSLSSVHVLLPSHAATPWSGPQRSWQPLARRVFLDALAYARDAVYGELQALVDDGEGNPRGDAVATVLDTGEVASADDAGLVRLLLDPGEYTVRFDRAGSVPVTVTVPVVPGETASVEVSLPDSGLGAVQGTVTSARGGGLEGAEVALPELEGAVATTGPGGTYTIGDVPGGTYTLTVSAEGHETVTVPDVSVVAGSAVTVDIELPVAVRAAVLGDRFGQLTALLNDAGVLASEIGWTDTGALDDLDVVVLNHPSAPGSDTFLAFLDAMDAAGVSGVFADDRFSGFGSVRFLRSFIGDPSAHLPVAPAGDIHLEARDPDHPLFSGFEGGRVHLLAPGAGAALLDAYSGIPLADLETETGGHQGVGAAYLPRTPDSVHLLVGGLGATVFAHPDLRWTEDTRVFFVNAVRWAAAPGLGELTGRVTDAGGQPVPGASVTVQGTGQVATVDADGRYRLAVAPGDHDVDAAGFGHVGETASVRVGRGEAVTLDFVLGVAEVGSVTGTVTARRDVRPQQEAGLPLEGARVRLLGVPRETLTGEDGTFALERVEPGTYDLEVLAEGHVRWVGEVEVAAEEATVADPSLRPSPQVGVLDDHLDHAAGYLAHWGYEPVPIGWDDLGAVAELDLVLANLASFPNLDPGPEGWRAFEDAVNRAGAPVLWLDQFGRGAIQWLRDYEGDPAVRDQGRTHGEVRAHAVVDHPLLEGLPPDFELTEPNREYAWFDGYSGETVARLVTSGLGEVGDTVAYRGRTSANADVLLSTLSISFYGWPAYADEPGHRYTPEAERLLRNALDWALDAPALAADARGSVRAADGTPLAGTVTVVETGVGYPVRDGDGTFVAPLQPGTWTLEASSFGYVPATVEVDVAAGDVARPQITLAPVATGTLAGRVLDADGLPVAGASLALLGTPLGTTSGEDGRYEIAGVPEGAYELEVRRDGFRVQRLEVSVAAGQTTTVDVTLPVSELVALVGDHTGAQLQQLLESEGYEVSTYPYTTAGLLAVTEMMTDYALLLLNGRGSTPTAAAFTGAVEAADAAGLSVILAGQWGSVSAVNHARNYLGDPESASWGFVPEAITYTPVAEHPIFAGFEVGEPVQILHNPGQNQQWLAFEGYSGTTLAAVGNATGERIGDGVAYRFTSPTSVHLLLASLGASIYGSPQHRWTPEAIQIYLNALAWALEASQGEISGTVTGEGEPLAGATVRAVEAGAQTRTGDDGRYRLGVADGEHTVRVEAFGFEPFETVVVVEESGSVTVDADLVALPRGALDGTVTDTAGRPLAGAEVLLDGPLEEAAVTSADGAFSFDDLLEGTYTVTASAEGHLPAAVEAVVVAEETVTVEVALQPFDVAVLGDASGVLVDFLRSHDLAATSLDWAESGDLDGYRVAVVGGGDVDAETFAGLLEAAGAAEASLVFTGTWGVAEGGIRLLERHTGEVSVGGHGYGHGPVSITGFDAEHPLFDGLDDPATILSDGGYYSFIDGYAGHLLADLATGDGGVLGTAVALDWRGAEHAHLLLSASAVTGRIGPGYGWTEDGGRLVVNAVSWLREASQPLPAAPTLEADAELIAAESVTVRGTAEFRATVTVLRDGDPVASAEPARDGAWSAEVPLVEGPNELVAVTSNFAGDSEPSPVVTVVRDTLGPELDWTPADGTGVFDPVVEVAGTATDPSGVALVEVGGVPVDVDASGAWGVEVTLVEGANTIVVRAVDVLGNETVEEREVAYLPYTPVWQVPPQASARGITPVRLTVLDGEEPLVLEAATLVVRDADGVEVVRAEMALQGEAYHHPLAGLAPGTYDLAAELAVEGWHVDLAGPSLRLR